MHRAYQLRVSCRTQDITLTTAFAPTEAADVKTKALFWEAMGKAVGQIPRRSQHIMGLDANGHVGKDPTGPQVGSNQPSDHWTCNGLKLAEVAYAQCHSLLNTLTT